MIAKTVTIITGLPALLCIAAFPLWILGVPGIENEYARGWGMGLQVIVAYPVCWFFVRTISRRMARESAEAEASPSIGPAALILMVLLFVTAAARLWYAFQVMGNQP